MEASSKSIDTPTNKTFHQQGELGYLGLAGVAVPHQKPRGGELTEAQKEANRQFASVRVLGEHGIRRVKAFRIVRDEYRLGTGLFGMIVSAPVGLVQLIRLVG